MNVVSKNLILTVSNGVCNITPHAGKRTVALLEHLAETIVVSVDTSRSVVGDHLVLIVKRDNTDDWGLVFSAENGVFFTSCRTPETEVYSPNNNTWIGNFYFDGTYFCNTYEDC